MRTEIRAWLSLAMVVHVGTVGVVLYALNAAAAYWSNFLTSVPFPRLFPFLAASSWWFPWIAVVIVAVGIGCLCKAEERVAIRVTMLMLLISIFIVSLTAVAGPNRVIGRPA